MIVIEPALQVEAVYLGLHLRAEDEAEVRASTGREPWAVLRESYALSRACFTVRERDSYQMIGMFGVADDPSAPGLGVVWFLGTDLVTRNALAVMREAPRRLDAMSEDYPLGLHNIADARNTLHLRWLAHMGAQQLGVVARNGHDFVHFHRPPPCVNPSASAPDSPSPARR